MENILTDGSVFSCKHCNALKIDGLNFDGLVRKGLLYSADWTHELADSRETGNWTLSTV